MSGSCPSPRVLEAIAASGAASGAASDHDSQHVANCASCQAALREIRENDSFLSHAAALRAESIGGRHTGENAGAIEIPGYQMLGEISRGGQGVVLRAIQLDTKRAAAVKMLLGGAFATPRQERRFDREIELAASLRHPNIVNIFESGTTRYGCRYVAMEYIDAVPLDRYVQSGLARDSGREHIRRVVALLTDVVDALRHAHGNGVIHRDLKPSNILVDAAGSPHVVDFGLARPVQRADDATVTGEFAGTPLFAAPEQFRGIGESIDVRTDVYALGVLLYFALTGRCPHSGASMRELMRAIVEDAADRPSRHNPDVDDDLDTIVLKSLAKEKERRYQSAAELYDDLQRYVRDEVIAAKRDSAIYVLRKTVGRYRLGFVAAAAVFVLATTMVILAVRSAERLRIERDQADVARNEAGRQRNIAVAVKNFMQQIVSDADPHKRGRPDLTMREVLQAAIADVESGRFAADPEVEAEVRLTLAATLAPLGAQEASERQCRAAIAMIEALHGREHASLAPAIALLADLHNGRGDVAGAIKHQDRLLVLLRRTHVEGSDEVQSALRGMCVLKLRNGDMKSAEALAVEVIAVAKATHGADSTEYDQARECMVAVYSERGAAKEAAQLAMELLERAEARSADVSLELGIVLSQVVTSLNATGDAQAIELGKRAVAIFLARLGPHAVDTARAYHDLAVAHYRADEIDAAWEYATKAVDIANELISMDPRGRGAVFNLAATLCVARGEVRRALPLMREAYAIAQEWVPASSESLAANMNNLAMVQVLTGGVDAGIGLFREALEIRRGLHVDVDHVSVAEGLCNLGFALFIAGLAQEAVALLKDGTEMRQRTLGPNHGKTAEAMVTWAAALIELDRLDEAEVRLDRAAKIFEAAGIANPAARREQARCYLRRGEHAIARDILAPHITLGGASTERHTLLAEIVFAQTHLALGCDESAQIGLQSVYARAMRCYGPDSFITRQAARVMAECYDARGNTDLAMQWRFEPPDPNAMP
ncbi:MAG: protein kinase domain-containing protein [Phycisphaerae bacterium]